jgi:hypothetical protein
MVPTSLVLPIGPIGRSDQSTTVQVITSRLLDARKTLVIALSILAGVAVEVFPTIAAAAPKRLALVIGSSLVLSTLTAGAQPPFSDRNKEDSPPDIGRNRA